MAGEQVIEQIIKMIGRGGYKLMMSNSRSRLVGNLVRNSREWQKAYGHIVEHFKPIPGKPSHATFEPKYRNEESVWRFVTATGRGPSRVPQPTLLTDEAGVANGKPAVVLEREFPNMVIGHKGATECRILRVIMDYTGRIITAYPVDRFIGGAAVAVAISSSRSAEASALSDVVKQIYAEEEEAAQKRIDHLCHNSFFAELVDFVGTTCTGLEPQELISDADLEKRTDAAIARIESQLGLKLDDETRQNIHDDIGKPWHRFR